MKEGHRVIPRFERRPAKVLAAAAEVAVEVAGGPEGLVEGVEGMGFGARHEVVS